MNRDVEVRKVMKEKDKTKLCGTYIQRKGFEKVWYTSKGDKVVEVGYFKGRTIRWSCVDIDSTCELFIEICKDEQVPMTLARLCNMLGLTKEEYIEATKVKPKDKNRWTLKEWKAKKFLMMLGMIEAETMEGVLGNKLNSAAAIFNLKQSYFGYTDKVEQVTEHKIDFTQLHRELGTIPAIEPERRERKIVNVLDNAPINKPIAIESLPTFEAVKLEATDFLDVLNGD